MSAMQRRGHVGEPWPRELRCLYVNRDLFLRSPEMGEEAKNGCGEDMWHLTLDHRASTATLRIR